MTSSTFVKKRDGLSQADFFRPRTEWTRDFDLVDHPATATNRRMSIAGDPPCIGVAENHGSDDIESLESPAVFYRQADMDEVGVVHVLPADRPKP